MKGSRKAHGFVCFQDNWLFCGGGLDDRDEALNTCEKYDIENEIWVECSKMVKKGSYFTLITFGEEYIYKFGGVLAQNGVFVEKYDVLNDKWLEINYFVENKSFGIGALCGGVQVNDRDIFVFGGVENHSEVNKSFVFRINEGKKNNAKYYITEVNSYVMPFEGFVDTITIVDKGQVLALVDSLKETSLNSKFILGFNGKKWEKIL